MLVTINTLLICYHSLCSHIYCKPGSQTSPIFLPTCQDLCISSPILTIPQCPLRTCTIRLCFHLSHHYYSYLTFKLAFLFFSNWCFHVSATRHLSLSFCLFNLSTDTKLPTQYYSHPSMKRILPFLFCKVLGDSLSNGAT